jgi:hypothetical protein
MEKQQPPLGGVNVDLGKLKIESNAAARDVDFGQVLEIDTNPALEKKVLKKIDLFL